MCFHLHSFKRNSKVADAFGNSHIEVCVPFRSETTVDPGKKSVRQLAAYAIYVIVWAIEQLGDSLVN